MKKMFLPYLPMFGLIFGLFIVQLSDYRSSGQLMSNILETPGKSTDIEICTKPDYFSDPTESAWCGIGMVSSIEKGPHNWNWSCIVGDKVYSCHFTESRDYKTRGGVFFSK